MSLWNVARALQSPYGILRNSYTPILPTIKAVYCWDSLAILTCQKPNFRSIVEKNQAPTMDSMVSCIQGRGNTSFLVRLLRLRKSRQNRRPPSFLQTRTTMLHQGDCDGQITPPSSISWICSRTSSTKGGAIRRNRSLKGSVSNNCITCSAVSVHSISFRSREKILWCSISICLNFRASLGGHSFNLSSPPSFQSISNNNFCLSLTISFLGGSHSGSISSNFLRNSREGVASGIMLAATSFANGHLVAKCTGLPIRLWSTTETRYNSIFQICCLSHDMQLVPHHHCSMSMAVQYGSFECQDCNFIF